MTEADEALAADRQLARSLPRVWDAFFSRFGRLTPVQRSAIPAILEGDDVLVCAPTAAGKTESACAPLVERYLSRRQWQILYVSPTRALVNDLFERLAEPLRLLNLTIGRRTGEHRDAVRDAPQILITTPESLDSMLCRGGVDSTTHTLQNVVGVVLDEIHLLHGSGRGEHVRWLLQRLRRLRGYMAERGTLADSRFQTVGLSATVADPEAVRDAYLQSGTIVRVRGARTIVQEPSAEMPLGHTEEVLPAYLRGRAESEKVLVFANSKTRVDTLAASLRDALEGTSYVVAAHHAALVQRERESAEELVRRERRVVLISTSTLEIGVDIGDIDLVVLDGPPPDVASLLQRIGRGNRRSGNTRVMLCIQCSADDLQQRAMLAAAKEGALGTPERGPHFVVARQQAASFILQSPTSARSRAQLADFLSQSWSAGSQSPEELVSHLCSTGDLNVSGDDVRLGDAWKELASTGSIHSIIEGGAGDRVVDQASGDPIALGVKLRSGRKLEIAGHRLTVAARSEYTIEVRRGAARSDEPAKWSYVTSPQLQGAGRAKAVRRHLGVPDDEWPVVDQGSSVAVFHFGGATTAAVLTLMAQRAGIKLVVDGWHLLLPAQDAAKPAYVREVGPGVLDSLVDGALETLERLLARPQANKKLPRAMRLEEVRAWLDLEAQIERIQASRWVTASPSVRSALETLINPE